MLFASLRQCAGNFGLHFKKLLWCVRSERGEMTERHHFHSLIGGLPSFAVKTATCFSIMRQWERIGGGMSRVYPYDSSLDGAEYVLKGCEEVLKAGSARVGASQYELTKFGGSCDVTLSESLIRHLANRFGSGQRGDGPESNKTGGIDTPSTHSKNQQEFSIGNVKSATIACITSLEATSV